MKRPLLCAIFGALPWVTLGTAELFISTRFPEWVWIWLYWVMSPLLAFAAIVFAVKDTNTSSRWQSRTAFWLSVLTLLTWSCGVYLMVGLMLYL